MKHVADTASILGAGGFGATTVMAQDIVLRASDTHRDGFPTVEAVNHMGKLIEQRTGGRTREQVKAGVWPVRLRADDWTSGEINWLFDVIALTREATTSVIANFKQVVKEGDLGLHPLVTRLVGKDTLERMGAKKAGDGD